MLVVPNFKLGRHARRAPGVLVPGEGEGDGEGLAAGASDGVPVTGLVPGLGLGLGLATGAGLGAATGAATTGVGVVVGVGVGVGVGAVTGGGVDGCTCILQFTVWSLVAIHTLTSVQCVAAPHETRSTQVSVYS